MNRKQLFSAILGLLSLCYFVAYTDGKWTADRWYAKHWHPYVQFSDLIDESKTNKTFVGMSPLSVDDVTLVGHGIVAVNTSHVIVVQCTEDTFSTLVALNTNQQFICSDAPEFKWKPLEGDICASIGRHPARKR